MPKASKFALLNMTGRDPSHRAFTKWEALLTELMFDRPWDKDVYRVMNLVEQGGYVWYVKAIDEANRLSSI